jgi:glutaredoxin
MLTIFSKDNCGYCISAKKFLDQHHVKYEEVNVNKDSEALEYIRERGHRTVPQIYNGDILIGGYDDLMQKKEMVL